MRSTVEHLATISSFLALCVLTVAAHAAPISTIAGGGPDGLPATTANMDLPAGVAAGDFGSSFVAAGNRIFAITDVSGTPIVNVLAGTGAPGYGGDMNGGFPKLAFFNNPRGLALDGEWLYIADTNNHCVRRLNVRTGELITVLGNGQVGSGADSGSPLAASFGTPDSVAVDQQHNVYVGDSTLEKVYRVEGLSPITPPQNARLSRFAGSGFPQVGGGIGDGGPAVNAGLSVRGITVEGNKLYIGDRANVRVRAVDLTSGIINTVAGGHPATEACGALAGKPTDVCLLGIQSLASDGVGDIFIGDGAQIWRMTPSLYFIKVVAGGTPGFKDGAISDAMFRSVTALAVNPAGGLLVADSDNQRIRSVDQALTTVSTAAGNGEEYYSGEFGPALSMSIGTPLSLAISGSTLFIGDSDERRVYAVDVSAPNARMSKFAGNGAISSGSPADPNAINLVTGIAVDTAGNLLISDGLTRVFRVPVAAGGPVQAFAGTPTLIPGQPIGSAGLAAYVPINSPGAVAVNPDCPPPQALVIERAFNRVFSVRFADGYTTVIPAAATPPLKQLSGIAASQCTFYLADAANNMIYLLSGPGTLTRIAGTGVQGSSGNGGDAKNATLNGPTALLFDGLGGLLVADTGNNQVRRIDLVTNKITLFAGTGQPGYSGDGGDALNAELNHPMGLAVDRNHNVYIGDAGNHRIRMTQLPYGPGVARRMTAQAKYGRHRAN